MDRHFQVFPELFELFRWEFWFVCSSPVRVVPTPVYSIQFEGLSNPLTVRHLSVPAALNQPHSMMLTPPSLTEGMFLGRCCLQMWCLEGSPNVYSRFHGGGTLQWWLLYWNLLPTVQWPLGSWFHLFARAPNSVCPDTSPGNNPGCPNTYHLRMIETTVFLRTFSVEGFFSFFFSCSFPHICALTHPVYELWTKFFWCSFYSDTGFIFYQNLTKIMILLPFDLTPCWHFKPTDK